MTRPQIDLKFGANIKDFRRGMSNIDRSLRQLSGGFGALGGVIGASFAVDAITQFVSESVKLGATMEGVRGAFERFADETTLDGLREAVSGTVDDLKLMQMAVRAKNFKIPMDVLAKGLKFATQRAMETGESVDYLVESFVIGLGRESVKILDNLGISTLEIQKKTKEVGDMTKAVGMIMDEAFENAGEQVVTTSMKIDQQKAAITNLKIAIGEQLAPIYSAFLDNTIDGLKNINNLLSKQTGFQEKAANALKTYFDITGKGQSTLGQLASGLANYLELQRKVEQAQEDAKLTVDDYRAAQKQYDAEQTLAEEKKKEALEKYQKKLEEVIPTIKMANYEIDKFFKPGTANIFKDDFIEPLEAMDTELENIDESVEDFGTTFDNSFHKTIETFSKFRDDFMAMGQVLKTSFAAAFGELEEGETRVGKFREVFVEQLKMMVAQLLATAAAAAVLAAILTIAFGGTNKAGQAMFGKAGMKFGDLFMASAGGMGGLGFNSAGMGDGGMNAIQIFGTLSGSDILLSNERASRNRSRSRGF